MQFYLSESTIETMDISLDKPTPFPNLGLTVQPVTSEDTKATSRYGPDTLFTMSIRKTSADKVNDKFSKICRLNTLLCNFYIFLYL
jgi:hypothetical protein